MWHKIMNKINGNKTSGQVSKFVLTVIIAVLLVAFIVPALINMFPPAITTASAREFLEKEGYWVIADGDCYPTNFTPCENDVYSLGSDEFRWNKAWLGSESLKLGSVELSNTAQQLDIDGQLVLHDAGKVWKEIQPDLDYATVRANGKPTQVYRGASSGFSLPIYGDDNEELFVSMDVPREWDGITNPIAHIHCYIPDLGNGIWVLPLSFVDYGNWTDEILAYDNDNKTYADNLIDGESWSGFLEFGIIQDLYSKVIFYAKYDAATINIIDIDAYYDSVWNDVYQGTYENKKWVSKDLGGDYIINKYRIRFYNIDVNPKDARLYETGLCSVSGKGNFNLELGYSNYTVGDNDSVPETVNLKNVETKSIDGSNKSYVVNLEIETIDMTVCDQLDLRLRRIEASEDEMDTEIVITHIGIQFLRDKLGDINP